MRTCHLIHGIRTEPNSPVKGLIPYLEDAGFSVRYPDYGFEWALETGFVNTMLEGALLPYIEPGDVVVGHSNGCALAYHLMQLGAPIKGAAFINGALEQKIVRPGTHVEFIDVYFNPGDQITEVAKYANEFHIVDSLWGELGHGGYVGNDPRIGSFNCGNTVSMPVVSGHSDFFTPVNLDVWGPFLANRLIALAGIW